MSVHLYSLACGQGYFFLGTDDVGVPEEVAVLFAVFLLLLLLLLGLGVALVVVLVLVAVVEVLIGGEGSGLTDGTGDAVAGGAEVGSVLAFVIGMGAWLDGRGGREDRLCCGVGGPRGLTRWLVGYWRGDCNCMFACGGYA